MEPIGFADTQPLSDSPTMPRPSAQELAPARSALVLITALGFGLFWWLTQKRRPRMKVLPISPRRGVR